MGLPSVYRIGSYSGFLKSTDRIIFLQNTETSTGTYSMDDMNTSANYQVPVSKVFQPCLWITYDTNARDYSYKSHNVVDTDAGTLLYVKNDIVGTTAGLEQDVPNGTVPAGYYLNEVVSESTAAGKRQVIGIETDA